MLRLIELVQTCSACPSQWEGETAEGLEFYARYRWGTLRWGLGYSPEDAARAAMESEGIVLGDSLDGVLSGSEMLREVGAEVV
jgi:hypothetical protein